ncbi:MAG: PAS domain S-box protein [Gammaproteobacteria bacterium]|nr:PAS domain S-box protein [Gammaproteobacteria bacterium]
MSSNDARHTKFFFACGSLFCIVGWEGDIRCVNTAWQDILGYTSAEIVKYSYLDLVHPDDRPMIQDHIDYLNTGAEAVVFASRFQHCNGDYRQILWQATWEADEGGFYAVGIDTTHQQAEVNITKHLKAKQTLRENKALLATIFEAANIGISLTDRENRFVQVNPAFCEIYGYSEEELLGKPADMVLPKIMRAKKCQTCQDDDPLPLQECQGVHKDGHIFEVELRASRLDQFENPLLLTLTTDITMCRQALLILRESEERLRLTIENLPIMVDALDANGNIVLWNRECERITGYTAKEMLHNPKALERLYPDAVYREKMSLAIQNVIQNDPGRRHGDWTLTCKDGSKKNITWSVNSKIKIPGFDVWSIGEDVTEREQALRELQKNEERLRQSEERLRLTIENLPIMVDAMDAEGNIVLWNHECERVMGYSAAEMLNNPKALEYLYPDAAYRGKIVNAVRSTINSKPGFRRGEWIMVCKNGERKTIAWSVNTGIKIPGFDLWGVGEDVSEREQALRKLRDNEQRLRVLVENMPVMLNAYGKKGEFVMWNRQCEKVTGYNATEIIGNSDALKLLYPRQDEHFPQRETRGQWETEITCKDGSLKTIAWTDASRQYPVSGWTRWLVGEDVTERVKIQQALSENNILLYSILDNLSLGVCVTNARQRVIYVNKAYCELYGYDIGKILNQCFTEVMCQDRDSFVFRHYFSFVAGAHGNFHSEVRTTSHCNGHPLKVVFTARRVTLNAGENHVIWMVRKHDS